MTQAQMLIGKKVRVYLQVDDTLLDISGDVSSFSISQQGIDITAFGDERPSFIPSYIDADIHIVGNGAWKLVDDFVLSPKTREWKCDFCGHVNPIEARYCGHQDKHAVGCGARRSFVVDMQND